MVKILANMAEYNECISGNALVVVDFTATWCPPCQRIGPEFVKLAESGDYGNVTFVKVDVDENNEASESAGISCMPTFQFHKDG